MHVIVCYCVIMLCCVVMSDCVIVVLLLCYGGIRWLRANRRAGPANGRMLINRAMRTMRRIISLEFGRAFVLYWRAGVVWGVGFVL